MSHDIHDQLRKYAEHFEAGLDDFELEDVTSPRATHLAERPSARPQRPWLVMVTAAVVVVMAIGGFAIFISGNGSQNDVIDIPPSVTTALTEPTVVPSTEPPPVTSKTPPTTQSPTTAPEATPPPPPLTVAESWQLVSDPMLFTDGTQTSSIAQATGALIIGGTDFESWPWEATVWRSTDGGATWTRLAPDALGAGEIQSVAADGDTVIAVGNEVVDLPNDWTEDRHAIWASSDAGLTWERVPFDEAVFGAGFVWRVVEGGSGFVATGRQCVGPLDTEQEASGLLGDCSVEEWVVWSSVDGFTWERRSAEVVPGAGLYDIQEFGIGLVIAGSWFATDSSFGVAAVWLSEDGTAWTRHELPVAGGPDLQPSVVAGIEAGGPGLVAVGWEGGQVDEPRIWTSPDGATWTPLDSLPSFENVTLWTLARVGTRLVAAGGYLGQVSPVVWWSDDGLTWTPAELAGEGSIWAATSAGQRAIAVGGTSVWVSPPLD
jgi:hypothetical protein